MDEYGKYPFIRKYGICYMMIAVFVLGMKWYNSSAGSEALRWILAPTARWVGFLSGVSFIFEPRIGYVNHSLRFIIAPSCSGIQFMIIVFVVLTGAFVHRMGTRRRAFCWMAGCAAAAVLLTVFVNGLRIVLAIYAPGLIFRLGVVNGWLTPERIHTVIGVIVYFGSLMMIYRGVDRFLANTEERAAKKAGWMFPVVIYGLIVLGLPLLNGALKNNREQFMGYAVLVMLVCLLVLCILHWVDGLWRQRAKLR